MIRWSSRGTSCPTGRSVEPIPAVRPSVALRPSASGPVGGRIARCGRRSSPSPDARPHGSPPRRHPRSSRGRAAISSAVRVRGRLPERLLLVHSLNGSAGPQAGTVRLERQARLRPDRGRGLQQQDGQNEERTAEVFHCSRSCREARREVSREWEGAMSITLHLGGRPPTRATRDGGGHRPPRGQRRRRDALRQTPSGHARGRCLEQGTRGGAARSTGSRRSLPPGG